LNKLKNGLLPILIISLTLFSATTLLTRAQNDVWITDPEGDVCSIDDDDWTNFWSEAEWDMGDEDLPSLHVLIDTLIELGEHENATCNLDEPAWVDIIQITMVEGDVNTTIEITMAGEIDGNLIIVGFSNCTRGGSGVMFGMIYLLVESDGGPDEYQSFFVIMNETDSLVLAGNVDANEVSFEFPTDEYVDSFACCTVFIALTGINGTNYWDWATDCDFDCPTCPNGDNDDNGDGDTVPRKDAWDPIDWFRSRAVYFLLFIILIAIIATVVSINSKKR